MTYGDSYPRSDSYGGQRYGGGSDRYDDRYKSDRYGSGRDSYRSDRYDSSRDRPRGGDRFGDLNDMKQHLQSSKSTDPILKNVFILSPITESRSEHEVAAYLRQHEIVVTGRDNLRPLQTFQELHVPDFVMEPIRRNRFTAPTPIQAQAWPLALHGNDVVGVAMTGSGKTYSFVLPAIVHIKSQEPKHHRRGPAVLVLAPTRELCQQISEVATEFARYAGMKVATIYGGAPKSFQGRALADRPEIVVATPGRLMDFMKTKECDVGEISYLVLDEADRMLDMGFEPQIRQILSGIRSDRQTLMFSATWPKAVHQLANEFLGDYVKVNIGAQDLHANHKIKQHVHIIDQRDKFRELRRLLDDILDEKDSKAIIFVETKRTADELSNQLYKDRFPVTAMHGDKNQAQREQALHDFKTGRRPLLLATDVASRGIDVKDVTYVVNYDYPNNSEDYVHRIGRTARSTATGTAHTFFTVKDASKAKDLVSVLDEAGQKVPDKLRDMAARSYEKFGGGRGGGRPRGGYGGGSSYGGGRRY